MNIIMYIYVAFVAVISISTGLSVNAPLLTACGLLLAILSSLKSESRILIWTRLALLGTFHWVSQSNWSAPLYLILMARDATCFSDTKKAWTTFPIYFGVSAGIPILFALDRGEPFPVYFVIMQLMNTAVTTAILRYHLNSVSNTAKLHDEKNRLTTIDALTGLYNFNEFHNRLGGMLLNRKLILTIIDCTDLKSMNTAKGFRAGNEILKQTAEVIQETFRDAHLIARYGGDEFAVLIASGDHPAETLRTVRHALESLLPQRLEMEITYGIAEYPRHGQQKDELISAAEADLFIKKREIWLKREEGFLWSEKLRVMGELASSMAHEIRNPLTTIKGFLQVSKSNGYNIERWFPLIMNEITRMNELTAEFLQFSKPHTTELSVGSLQHCILRVISLTESEALNLGHQIRSELPDNPLCMAMDPDKIVQLLLNLVKNAYEAMPISGMIALRLYRRDKLAIVEIEDTGKGIPPDHIEKIFQPFFTSKKSGTGLGLSICLKIAHDHDGTITVYSEVDKGTTFTIAFPIAEPEISSF